MCGIRCCYKCCAAENKRLINRGPDHQQTLVLLGGEIALSAYILHVQGQRPQPCSTNRKHLIYNGQCFTYPEEYDSDTEYILQLLDKNGVLETVTELKGPCAAIFYDEKEQLIWFWRDYFGRRSLLLKLSEEGMILSSVGDGSSGWVEVPAGAVFCVDSVGQITCYPCQDRQDKIQEFGSAVFTDDRFTVADRTLPQPILPLNTNLLDVETLDWSSVSHQFLDLLSGSVRVRAQCCGTPLPFTQELLSDYTTRHSPCTVHTEYVPSGARLGVLFSGGIDCTVLAALLHRSTPAEEPIDLINVSFGKNCHSTPDRISAFKSLADLQSSCQNRKWNLIKVDVTLEELRHARSRYISDLLYPHNTVLDDSIGCALWFAARGVGKREEEMCFSTARLLFSGIGADELMGGYSRHRGAWERNGDEEMIREIEMDINRISERNLGRDNRVIGDHQRDCVAPFLDESFVSFVNSLSIHYKVNFELPRGQGEKVILRKVAEMLGLPSCSVLPKKAIQFGSKIAKLEKRKEKGGDVCSRLVTKDGT